MVHFLISAVTVAEHTCVRTQIKFNVNVAGALRNMGELFRLPQATLRLAIPEISGLKLTLNPRNILFLQPNTAFADSKTLEWPGRQVKVADMPHQSLTEQSA